MPSINMPTRPEAPINGILGIVNAYSNWNKNAGENALNAEKLKGEQLANTQTQIAQGASQAQIKALQDPTSPQSAQYKQSLLGSIALARQAFPVKDPDAQSALQGTIQKLQDPTVSAWDAKQNIESSPLLNVMKDFGDKQIAANAAAQIAKIKIGPQEERVTEQKNQNSIEAGNAFESDPIIKLSKGNMNSLTKSQSILENPNKAVYTNDLNLAYNDYINAVAAGGAATEGKISRELPETWVTDFNTLKRKAGVNDDLRNNPTGMKLINDLKENISSVRHDMGQQISDQAGNLFQNFQSSTNPKVQAIAKQKLQAYAPDKYAQIFGGPVGNQSYTSSQTGPAPYRPSPQEAAAELARRTSAASGQKAQK